jgi:hypothetical protein
VPQRSHHRPQEARPPRRPHPHQFIDGCNNGAIPPAAAGPQPKLSLSYNSGAVDGRTAVTNNQGSQVGEGFDLTSSFIERTYGSCDDDGQADKFDLCWKYDNASLVLNGQASELVKDDTTGAWRLQNDDASTVTRSTGADNTDDNGEHWTVITGDGTKYVFGLNKLAGASTDDRTNSVWTVPVFGDDEGEPGYADGSSFSGRAKTQAWRWNLDYVEDTHGNAMSYWYTAEHNNYDKLGDDTIGTDYVRGGYLKEIRYGQRADTLFSGSPAASNKVVFDYAERCLASGTGCDSLTEDTRDNWPDVPFDSVCKDGDKCTGNPGPTFFTRKRLTTITTHAWNAAATTPGFDPVQRMRPVPPGHAPPGRSPGRGGGGGAFRLVPAHGALKGAMPCPHLPTRALAKRDGRSRSRSATSRHRNPSISSRLPCWPPPRSPQSASSSRTATNCGGRTQRSWH